MNRSKKKDNTQKEKKNSLKPSNKKTLTKTPDTKGSKDNTDNEKQAKFDTFREWGTLIASGIAVIISIFAFFNSHEQTKLAEKSLKFSNRPYIIIKINEDYSGGRELDNFEITIKNIGQTPSYKTRIFAEMEITKVDSITLTDDNYRRAKEIKLIGVLEKDISNNTVFIITDSLERINRTDIGRINSKEIFVFIYGYITYEDIFKDTHRTEFCFWYNSSPRWFEFYKKYNEAY